MKGFLLKKAQNAPLSSYDSLGNLLVKKDKSQKDCEAIYQLIQSVQGFNSFIDSFLKGLSHDQVIHLCSKFEFKKYLKGDIIFRQGDAHDNRLYLILSGSVMIFINRDMDDEAKEKELQPKGKKEEKSEEQLEQETPKIQMSLSLLAKLKGMGKNALAFINKKGKGGFVSYITNEEKEALKKKYGNTTRIIGSGKYFGEKALLNNDSRSATIVVDQHLSEIITLEKKYFKEFLDGLLQIVQCRKETITQIFPEMNNYTQQKMDNMLYCFQPENYTKGNHLCIEGGKEDKVFVVQEGEIQLEKNIRIEGEVRNKIRKKNVQIKVSILSNGGVVGEELFLNDNYCYYYTCTVLSPKAIILVGDKKSIEVKFPNTIKDMFKSMWDRKEKLRQEIIQSRRTELQLQAEQHSNALELRQNLEKAQNFYSSSNKSQQTIKNITQRSQNNIIDDQNAILGQSPSSQRIHVRTSNSPNKSKYLSPYSSQEPLMASVGTNATPDSSLKYDLAKEYQMQKIMKNQSSSKNLEVSKDSKSIKEEELKLSQPENYVYDFGDQDKKQNSIKKQHKLSNFTEKPKIPLKNVDISKKFDSYVKNYKNNYLFSKELNDSLVNNSVVKNDGNVVKEQLISIENLKDSSDSSRLINSTAKVIVTKEQEREDEFQQQPSKILQKSRRESKSSYDLGMLESINQNNTNLLKSLQLSKRQKSEKLIEHEKFSSKLRVENMNEHFDSSSPIQFKRKISQFNSTLGENGFNLFHQEDRKSSFQLFKQLSKISDPQAPTIASTPTHSFMNLKSSTEFNKDAYQNQLHQSQQNDLNLSNLPKLSSHTPSMIKNIELNKAPSICLNFQSENNNEGLTQKEKMFNQQQKHRNSNMSSLKAVLSSDQSQLQQYPFSKNGEVKKKRSILGVSPTSSFADIEMPYFLQNSHDSTRVKKKTGSFQIKFQSYAVSPERNFTEQEQNSIEAQMPSQQNTIMRNRKGSEHQKSQYFENSQKEHRQPLKMSKPSIPQLPSFQTISIKKGNFKSPTASDLYTKNIENIFMDIKQKKVIFSNSPSNQRKNPLQEYGIQQKAELIKLSSYFQLDDPPNNTKGADTLVNIPSTIPTNPTSLAHVPLKCPTLHELRLKQFKNLKVSLNQKKSASMTKLNVSTPRLEIIVNTNTKAFNIDRS